MRIGLVGLGIMLLVAAGAANAVQAQIMPIVPLIQPAQPSVTSGDSTSNNGLIPAGSSPVPPFVESPVGPYGRAATPISPPAAPVVGRRSTTLIPNGVLLSNGALVEPNTVLTPATSSRNRAASRPQQILEVPYPVIIEPGSTVINGVVVPRGTTGIAQRGRRTNSNNASDNSAAPRGSNTTGRGSFGQGTVSTGAPTVPTPPSPITTQPPTSGPRGGRGNVAAREALTSQLPNGTSLSDVVETLGTPVVTVNQDGGQFLYFSGGARVFVQDGAVAQAGQ